MNFRHYCTFVFAGFIGFLIAFVLFIGHYYFHELGHILLGLFSNLLLGYIPKGLHLTNWNELWGVPYPTTTKFDSIINTYLFAFGGPIFTVIWGLLLATGLYKLNRFKGKINIFVNIMTILILFIYLVDAIIGNILFGTDNWINGPILNWDDYPMFSTIYNYQGLFLLAIMTIAFGIALFPYMKQITAKFNST